jgi:hypothetical protein
VQLLKKLEQSWKDCRLHIIIDSHNDYYNIIMVGQTCLGEMTIERTT